MNEVSKADWKLFREKVAGWQERHMESLVKEYIAILESDGPASDKFWELEKRIKKDRKTRGVLIELKKQNVAWDIAGFLSDGIITEKDLDGFSEDMKNMVRLILSRQ